MRCLLLLLLLRCTALLGQPQPGQLSSPYVAKRGKTIYWAVTPAMDSAALNALSQTLLREGVFFKPVIVRDPDKQPVELWGNVIVFDMSRTKPTDTLLSNGLILPEQQKKWLASQSINVGHTRATLRIPPLGFWYEPTSGLHSDEVGENFPKSLRDRVQNEFPATAVIALAEHNKKQINDFKTALAKGKPAFPFTLPDSTGKSISLSDYKGKVVYLDFWASWCQPCIGEMKDLKRLEKRLKNNPDLVILYISIDEPNATDKWKASVKKHQFLGTHLLAKGGYTGSTARSYGINEVPTKFIIDRNGNFYATKLPYPTGGEMLVDLLEKALAEK